MRLPATIGMLTALCVLCMVGCDDDGGGITENQEIIGSGALVDEARSVDGFTAVTLAGEGTVRVEHGAQEGLLVRAQANLLPYILSEVAGGVLEIRTAAGVEIVPTIPIEYGVDLVTLESLSLSGVGGIECLDMDMDATDLEVRIDGVGDVRLAGQANRQTVRLGGVGDYDGRDLLSREAIVTIQGVGTVTVNVSETLVADVAVTGTVFYVDSSAGDLIVTCNPSGACLPAP